MLRVFSGLIAGLSCGACITGIFSVFLLHDLDKDHAGRLGHAFASLCAEGLVFALFVGCVGGLLALIVMLCLRLRDYPPRVGFAFTAGAIISLLQYPGDFATRKVAPAAGDKYLYAYILFAILASAAALIVDSFRWKHEYLAWAAANGRAAATSAEGATTYQPRAKP